MFTVSATVLAQGITIKTGKAHALIAVSVSGGGYTQANKSIHGVPDSIKC